MSNSFLASFEFLSDRFAEFNGKELYVLCLRLLADFVLNITLGLISLNYN
jgi:hypothetical protein